MQDRTDPSAAGDVRLAEITYALPAGSASVEDLAAGGALASEPDLLRRFGFDRVAIATTESPYSLALAAARDVLRNAAADPSEIDVIVYAGEQGPGAFLRAGADRHDAHATTARFRYPASRLQYDLGLDRALVLGVDQLACTSLLGAVRVARALCLAEGFRTALCVCGDFVPRDAGREALWNCTADAAVAVLLRRGEGARRVVAARHVTKGYYWDPEARRDEMIAAYFPTARHVIDDTLRAAGWSRTDVDWVIPHNVSRRSWDVLLPLCGLGGSRIWDRNIARIGHTLAGDNFINLADAVEAGAIESGQRLLLFSYGYGAHWTALAVEA